MFPFDDVIMALVKYSTDTYNTEHMYDAVYIDNDNVHMDGYTIKSLI